MDDKDRYFKYLDQPKKRSIWKSVAAGLLIIVCAAAFGFLFHFAIQKLDGRGQPGKKKPLAPSPSVTGTAVTKAAEDGPSPTPRPEASNTPGPSQKASAESVSMKTTLSEETLAALKNDKREPVKVKGIYVSGPKAGSSGMEDLIRLLDETELNAMVIDVKNDSGEITYKMDYDMAKEIGATVGYIRDMEALVKKLKEKKIYLIARIVAFKDPILAEKKQEYSLKTKDGGIFRDKDGLAWVNPYRREVWDYLVSVAKEAASIGFDEIQFDYIRFSTDSAMKDVKFGREAKGISRQKAINGFAAYACEQLMPLGVFVSADVYGSIITTNTDVGTLGQDYAKMASCVDYICPMVYPSHYSEGVYQIPYPDTEPYDLILHAMEDSKKILEQGAGAHQAKVRPWLQDFTATWVEHHITYGKQQIQDQIRAVYDAGYEEWILWNPGNHYTESALKRE